MDDVVAYLRLRMYMHMMKDKRPDDNSIYLSDNDEMPVVIEGVIPSVIGKNTSNTHPLDSVGVEDGNGKDDGGSAEKSSVNANDNQNDKSICNNKPDSNEDEEIEVHDQIFVYKPYMN